jgi:hypothetical protein
MMYCSACGQLNSPNATICSQCGRAIHAGAPGTPTPMPVVNDRVERHIQTVSILWLVYALLGVIGWFIAIPILSGIFGTSHPHHRIFPFMGFGFPALIPFITGIVLFRAGLQLLTGIALLMRVRWGRILAIVVSILTLLKIPLGTALGIYTLWVLLPGESGYAYDRLATHTGN